VKHIVWNTGESFTSDKTGNPMSDVKIINDRGALLIKKQDLPIGQQ
jgi:hypothetical protein